MRGSAATPETDLHDGFVTALPEVTFRVLGPLALARGADSLVLPPSKVAVLLAALLLHPNDVVSIGALREAIWGDDQPLAAKGALQTCAMRLRQLFVRHEILATAIETVPGGYRIVASAESVDLVRFRELARAADAEPAPDRRIVLLDRALALWRGPLLANVPSDTLHRDAVPRLNEERLRVLERVCGLKIEVGQAASALVQLWEATRAYPGNERLAAQLIEALYRTGRQSEALAEYRRVRDYLAEELGVGPGAALQDLELDILRGRDLADRASAPPRVEAGPVGVVRLPPPPGFVGRAAATRRIAERLVAGAGVVVVTGSPGVGKTALARHVAAAVEADFPAGALLIAMRAADGEPRTGADVAALLDGRHRPGRALVVLDDVAGVQQALDTAGWIEPGDALLLTSQYGLAGVVARSGGRIERLAGLEPAESVALLAGLVGTDRIGAEPAAAAALAAACAHLPLALRIAAARLLSRPAASVAETAGWLGADPIGRLALPDDPDMSLRRRFDLAVHRLPDALATAFLRLGTAFDGAFPLAAAADRLGIPAEAAEAVVDQLSDAGLLGQLAGGGSAHYRVPDLLRLYTHSASRTEHR